MIQDKLYAEMSRGHSKLLSMIFLTSYIHIKKPLYLIASLGSNHNKMPLVERVEIFHNNQNNHIQ